MRAHDRKNNQLREIQIIPHVCKWAEGSCLVAYGDTKVICTATVETKVPMWLKKTGTGWVTAEYGMLPRSCSTRVSREAETGRKNGRNAEIQRIIGRSLRSVVQLDKIGERNIVVDCDVIHADGGTRTASITGGYVALYFALKKLKTKFKWDKMPITDCVAAVSCGIVNGELMLDLDFEEDSNADTDCNIVMTESGGLVEVQSTAEKVPFTEHELSKMIAMARASLISIYKIQKEALTPKYIKEKEEKENIGNVATTKNATKPKKTHPLDNFEIMKEEREMGNGFTAVGFEADVLKSNDIALPSDDNIGNLLDAKEVQARAEMEAKIREEAEEEARAEAEAKKKAEEEAKKLDAEVKADAEEVAVAGEAVVNADVEAGSDTTLGNIADVASEVEEEDDEDDVFDRNDNK